MELFSANSGVLHIVRACRAILVLSGALPWPHHCSYTKIFYRHDLLNQGNTQRVRWKDVDNVLNKMLCMRKKNCCVIDVLVAAALRECVRAKKRVVLEAQLYEGIFVLVVEVGWSTIICETL